MKSGNTISVNNLWLPPPTLFEPEINDLDEFAYRLGNGDLVRSLIGSAWKISVEWDILEISNDFFELFSYLQSLPSIVQVIFQSPSGGYVTIKAYRTATIKSKMIWNLDPIDNNLRRVKYQGLKTGFVEIGVKNYSKFG